MPARKRAKKKKTSSLTARLAITGVALVVLVAVIWVVAGDRPGRPPSGPTDGEFGDRILALAERREATRTSADDPIQKVDGVFVRTWGVTLPTREAARSLAEDLRAEAATWQAEVTRDEETTAGGAQLRIDLGLEAFDLHLRIEEPARTAKDAPSYAPAPSPAPTARPQPRPGARGKLAVILDDAGQSLELIELAASLPSEVAFSVLPFLPHSAAAAVELHRTGHEIWLHLPMEPVGYPGKNPGPGAVLVSMSEAEIRSTVRSALNNVPHVVGMNNHMGSRATADLRTMTWVMQEIAARGLGFVDSRTTVDTLAEEAARAQGVKTGRRRVFLDNDARPEAIRAQLEEAVYQARLHGRAIAIGHQYETTLRVLERELPTLSARGAVLVAPTEILR